MEILIVHDEQLKNYVSKVSDYLVTYGFTTTIVDIAEYTGSIPVTSVPTFLIKKSDKEGYAMRGKQPLDVILNWAKNSGAGNY